MTSLEDHPRRYCPACARVVRREFLPGPGGREQAKCPRCKSFERHRFFALLLPMLGLGRLDTVLEVAPSPQTTRQLAGLGARRHLRLDIGYDERLVDVLGSLTELPLREASVDLLVCYHVLEHIPDDAAAMRELTRVLAADGVGLVQVPWRPGTPTEEDLEADESERLRRFGQRDHVRLYGDDFEDRLTAAGLAFDRVSPLGLLGEDVVTWCRLRPQEPVWIVRRADAPAARPDASVLTSALGAALGEVAKLREQLAVARAKQRV